MKQVFFIIGMFCAISLRSQPFLSITATTKGEGFSIGYLKAGTGMEISGGINAHIFRADVPRILYLSAGRRFLLSRNKRDNFNITPAVGIAGYSVKDFSDYDKDLMYGTIKPVKKMTAIYRLEMGKDWNLGRLFVSANYCTRPFWGIGIRAFIK